MPFELTQPRRLHTLEDYTPLKATHPLGLNTPPVCTLFEVAHPLSPHTLQYAHFSTHNVSLQALSVYISLQFVLPFSLHPLSICTPLEFTKVAYPLHLLHVSTPLGLTQLLCIPSELMNS